jgi:hypothetical protein
VHLEDRRSSNAVKGKDRGRSISTTSGTDAKAKEGEKRETGRESERRVEKRSGIERNGG